MSRTAKRFHTIREASELLDVPESTLRYWEQVFPQLSPKRTRAGHRRYTTEDIEIIRRIKTLLYDHKVTIEGAKATLCADRKRPPYSNLSCSSREEALSLIENVIQDSDSHSDAVLRLMAVREWLRGLMD